MGRLKYGNVAGGGGGMALQFPVVHCGAFSGMCAGNGCFSGLGTGSMANVLKPSAAAASLFRVLSDPKSLRP